MRSLERRLTELEQRIAPGAQSEAVTVFVYGAALGDDGQIVEADDPPLVMHIAPPHIQRLNRGPSHAES